VDFAPLGGRQKADIVFPRRRVAVFIDGCFWHSCPFHGSLPETNRDYWLPKLARNAERDSETTARLEAAGWRVLRFWEHVPPMDAAAEIIALIRPTMDDGLP